jgi:hypothetical protein
MGYSQTRSGRHPSRSNRRVVGMEMGDGPRGVMSRSTGMIWLRWDQKVRQVGLVRVEGLVVEDGSAGAAEGGLENRGRRRTRSD